ncbi:MAG: cold shock domain-containing protein [Nitrospirae bacterium]|nr:cold shock domain-containing protein [Nitrospirota bacterium]
MSEIKEGKRCTGKVIWFSAKTGFGFIAPDSGEKDLFVYWKNILMDNFKVLKPDQIVEYEIGQNDKGPQAINVKIIKDVAEK